ncbi:MAG: DUF4167 domain-containing protein [Pseudomonadota bacterium]|jgi:hypothetical protein|nr:DUF4167 domain-containing protein [Pseudomonadota bacterium]QKK06033.1 MAG: DUF4167 domain-containing protein [Pseudomonadota bacterium]
MKHGSNPRRSRNSNGNNRAGRNRTNNSRTQVFDSNGPDVRIRGNAQQVYDKYVALARDASAGSDHVLAESYLQHAEHYQRLINANEENKQQQQPRSTNSKADGVDGNVQTPVVDGKDVSLADEIETAEKRNRASNKTARTPEPA